MLNEYGFAQLPTEGSAAINIKSVDFRNLQATIPGADVDIDGQPHDENSDAGADEVSGATIIRKPLEARIDVGPTWMQGDPTKISRIPVPKPVPPRH